MYKTLPIVTFDMIVRVYENESGMETGNRSWKWKSEMKKQNTPIAGAGYCGSYPFPVFPYAQPITGLGEWRAVGLVEGRVSNLTKFLWGWHVQV